MGDGPSQAKKKGTRNEQGTPTQTMSGDWSESKNVARTRNLAKTRTENWAKARNLAKARSEETRREDADRPEWGTLGKTQAIGGMLGKTRAIGQEERREAKQTPKYRARHVDEGFSVDR